MSRAAITQRRRQSRWIECVTTWYCGWRRCSRCGELRYCAGRTYEAQRCKDCATGPGGW